MAGCGDNLGFAEDLAAFTAVAALGAAVLCAGSCNCRGVDDLGVLVSSNGQLCLVGDVHGWALKINIVDHAGEGSAVVARGGLCDGKGIGGAQGYLLERRKKLEHDLQLVAAGKINSAEVDALNGVGLEPQILICSRGVYLNLERCALALLDGNVIGTGYVKLAAYETGDELEEGVGVKIFQQVFYVKAALEKLFEYIRNLVGVKLLQQLFERLVVADKLLEQLKKLVLVKLSKDIADVSVIFEKIFNKLFQLLYIELIQKLLELTVAELFKQLLKKLRDNVAVKSVVLAVEQTLESLDERVYVDVTEQILEAIVLHELVKQLLKIFLSEQPLEVFKFEVAIEKLLQQVLKLLRVETVKQLIYDGIIIYKYLEQRLEQLGINAAVIIKKTLEHLHECFSIFDAEIFKQSLKILVVQALEKLLKLSLELLTVLPALKQCFYLIDEHLYVRTLLKLHAFIDLGFGFRIGVCNGVNRQQREHEHQHQYQADNAIFHNIPPCSIDIE